MPNRIVCGEALWKSDKLAKVEPEWVRPELANLIPLALANGTFECDARKIWSEVYSFNRPSITVEKVVQILDSLEAAKILFRWNDTNGKAFGYWVGIEKSGRLPSPSQVKGHYAKGPDVPREQLESFVGNDQKSDDALATPMRGLSDASATPRPGLGVGLGLGVGKDPDDARPENRPTREDSSTTAGKRTDSRFEPIKQSYIEQFERKNPGVKATFDGSDGKALKDFLQQQPEAPAEKVIGWLSNAFESDNVPPLGRGFRLRAFCSHFAQYTTGPKRTSSNQSDAKPYGGLTRREFERRRNTITEEGRRAYESIGIRLP
jgi:hypothetical protein